MKLTRGELKKLIEEEIEQGLEEGWWDDTLRSVDKVAGTKMSKKSKRLAKQRRDASLARAKEMEADAEHARIHDPSSMHYDKEAALQRDRDRTQARKDKAEEEAWAASKGRLAKADRDREKERKRKLKGDPKVYTPGGVDDDPWNKTHRVSNRAGSGNMGYGESIDRDELTKAIREELAKVLQGK